MDKTQDIKTQDILNKLQYLNDKLLNLLVNIFEENKHDHLVANYEDIGNIDLNINNVNNFSYILANDNPSDFSLKEIMNRIYTQITAPIAMNKIICEKEGRDIEDNRIVFYKLNDHAPFPTVTQVLKDKYSLRTYVEIPPFNAGKIDYIFDICYETKSIIP